MELDMKERHLRTKLQVVVLVLLLALSNLFLWPSSVGAVGEVSVGDSNIAWSPYGWVASGTTYKQTATVGSYVDIAFSGTTLGLNVDASMIVSPANPANMSVYAYIDGSATPVTKTMAQVSSGQLIFSNSLSSGNHYAHIVLAISINNDGRWYSTGGSPKALLRITSFQLDGSGTTLPLSGTPLAKEGPKILYYGDSITEGNTINADTTGANSVAARVGQVIGGPYGVHGYGSLMWWFSILSKTTDFYVQSSGSPETAVWNNYYQGTSLLNTATDPSSGYKEGVPDAVYNNNGINDLAIYGLGAPYGGATALSNFNANVGDWLVDERAAIGARPAIFMVMPFNYNCTTDIAPSYTSGQIANIQLYRQNYLDTIQSYIDASHDNRVFVIDLGEEGCQIVQDNSSDHLHPNSTGAQLLGDLIAAASEPNIILDVPLRADANGQDLAVTHTLGSSVAFSGRAPAASAVTVSVSPGDYSCTATVDHNGDWSCQIDGIAKSGNYNFLVTAVTTYGQTLTYGPYSINVTGPETSTTLAESGFDTRSALLLSLALMTTLGLVLARRRYYSFAADK